VLSLKTVGWLSFQLQSTRNHLPRVIKLEVR
jgi:hypothetical protein